MRALTEDASSQPPRIPNIQSGSFQPRAHVRRLEKLIERHGDARRCFPFQPDGLALLKSAVHRLTTNRLRAADQRDPAEPGRMIESIQVEPFGRATCQMARHDLTAQDQARPAVTKIDPEEVP